MSENENKGAQGQGNPAAALPPVVVIGLGAATKEQIAIALQAWEKNFPEGKFVTIGNGGDIPLELQGKNAVWDRHDILAAAVASDQIPERFIYTPIETFPVNPIREADLEVLKAWDAANYPDEIRGIEKMMKRQIRYYYPIVLPVVFEKTKVAEVSKAYKLDKTLVDINTLYFNHVFPDAVPFQASVKTSVLAVVTRSNPDLEKVAEVLPERIFVHCNADGLGAIAGLLAKQLE